MAALAVLAVASMLIAPYFAPKKFYTTDGATGGMSAWMYGTAHSSTTVRGNGIPTIILGNAGSKYSSLGMEQLPYAFVLLHEDDDLFDIQSSVEFPDDKGPKSTTTIIGNGRKLVIEYKLHAESTGDTPEIIERLTIDGNRHDLSNGRLFTIDRMMNIVQEPLEKIDRSVFPSYAEGNHEQFSNFLQWWDSITKNYSINAG